MKVGWEDHVNDLRAEVDILKDFVDKVQTDINNNITDTDKMNFRLDDLGGRWEEKMKLIGC